MGKGTMTYDCEHTAQTRSPERLSARQDTLGRYGAFGLLAVYAVALAFGMAVDPSI